MTCQLITRLASSLSAAVHLMTCDPISPTSPHEDLDTCCCLQHLIACWRLPFVVVSAQGKRGSDECDPRLVVSPDPILRASGLVPDEQFVVLGCLLEVEAWKVGVSPHMPFQSTKHHACMPLSFRHNLLPHSRGVFPGRTWRRCCWGARRRAHLAGTSSGSARRMVASSEYGLSPSCVHVGYSQDRCACCSDLCMRHYTPVNVCMLVSTFVTWLCHHRVCKALTPSDVHLHLLH
jgi:hypothetical protein